MSEPKFWRAANLRSRQGVDITVGYGIAFDDASGQPHYRATNISMVCKARDGILLASSAVTLVLINRYIAEDTYFQQEKVWIVPMPFADSYIGISVMSGYLDAALDAQYVAGDFMVRCRPQVAVVVNGEWQVDPMQPGEQHNFNFDWILHF